MNQSLVATLPVVVDCDVNTADVLPVGIEEKSFWGLVEEWLACLTGEKENGEGTGKRAKSEKTISSYRYTLQAFKNWLDVQGISEPSRQTIKDYRAALDKKNLSVNSKNLFLAGVRSFFKWLSDEYGTALGIGNLAAGIEGWQVSTEHKRGVLSLDETKKLIATVDTADLRGKRKKLTKIEESRIELRRVRDKAILSVLCCAGIRTIELSRLRVTDIYKTAGIDYLRVLGKGRQDVESVKINPKVAEKIHEWLAAREAEDIVSDDSPMFCSLSYSSLGAPLTPHAVSCLVKFYLEEAKLKTKVEKQGDKETSKPITAHSLRGSLATNSYLNGAKLDQVMAQLRHRHVSTTLRYIQEADKATNPCSDIISNSIF